MKRLEIEQSLERMRTDGRLRDPRGEDMEEAPPSFAEGPGKERAPA